MNERRTTDETGNERGKDARRRGGIRFATVAAILLALGFAAFGGGTSNVSAFDSNWGFLLDVEQKSTAAVREKAALQATKSAPVSSGGVSASVPIPTSTPTTIRERGQAPAQASTRPRAVPSTFAAPTAAGSASSTAFGVDLTPEFAELLPYSVALGQVVCESNFPLDEATGLRAEIAQLQIDLVDYLGVPRAEEKIELCLFADQTSYVDFIKRVFPGAPVDRPALYVKADGPGVLMVKRDSRTILNVRHEMTHAYLNASLRNVPIWLDEGLAKYFETPPMERGFENPFLKDAERNASGLFSAPPSLARLEKLTRVDQMRTREYRESWSWVHFLIHYSPETHRVLAFYLRSLRPEAQAGISQQEAFALQKKTPVKKLLDKYVDDYGKKYVEHFRNWEKRKSEYERGSVVARGANGGEARE